MLKLMKLLNKEIKLVANPAIYLTPLLAAMLLIPSYPYIVIVLFSYIGIQISFQVAIGNKDDKFTAMLPISRSEVVLSKFLLIWYIEGLHTVAMIIFALIADFVVKNGNTLSLDANFAFFGEALIYYGVFNFVFLSGYFKSNGKMGLPLILGLTFAGIVGGVIEIVIAVVPVLKANLDGLSSSNISYQLIMLAIGILLSAALNFIGYKKAVKNFAKVNL